MRRAALLLLVLVGGWLLAGVATAGPAAAHATLAASDPPEGARLESPPAEVRLEFTESVSLDAGYARVLAADGTRVDTGSASVDGEVVTIPLRDDLPDGGHLVTYRVISADSHPVSGAYSFVVGDGELVEPDAAGSADEGDPVVSALLPAVRWVGFAGLAAAIGVPVLALLCGPAGWASAGLRRLALAGAGVVAVAALASFLLQGAYAAGVGLGSLLDPSLLQATAASGTGWALLVRAVLAVALAGALLPAWCRGEAPERVQLLGAAVFAVGLVLSTAAVGHPVAGPWPGFAVAVTAVHVAAMAVWVGGLVGLLTAVLRPQTVPADLAAVLPRFSRLAFVAVVALVLSGIVQAVREVGSPAALTATAYGWLLITKVTLVLVALGAAGVSRVWVQQRLGVRSSRPAGRRSVPARALAATGAPGPAAEPADDAAAARVRLQSENAAEHLPTLRRSVMVEVTLAAVVLALSAVLVGTPPARSTLAEPVDVVLPLQGATDAAGSVQISVDPARPGPNTLHVYLFDDSGRLTQPAGIEVTLTERSQDIGPLEVDLEPAGPGHYVAYGMPIPGPGTWALTVSVRVDEFTATTASTDFPVR